MKRSLEDGGEPPSKRPRLHSPEPEWIFRSARDRVQDVRQGLEVVSYLPAPLKRIIVDYAIPFVEPIAPDLFSTSATLFVDYSRCYVCGSPFGRLRHGDQITIYMCDRDKCRDSIEYGWIHHWAHRSWFFNHTWLGSIIDLKRTSGQIQKAVVLGLTSGKNQPHLACAFLDSGDIVGDAVRFTPWTTSFDRQGVVLRKIIHFQAILELNPTLPTLAALTTASFVPIHPTIQERLVQLLTGAVPTPGLLQP